MFYVFNDTNVIKTKKGTKGVNPYREAIKNLVADIKSTDFDILINTNVYIQSSLSSEIDKLLLKIYTMKDINYKLIEKELDTLYKKFGLLNMLNMYVFTVNQILDSYLFNLVVAEDDQVKVTDNNENYYKTCSLLAKISIYSIIVANDLLNSKIDYIENDIKDYKFVKQLKREKISLVKGLYDVPVLLSTKEARYFKNSLEANTMSVRDISPYFHTYTIVQFQQFTQMLFFKDDFKKYFKFEYEYDNNRLYGKTYFTIDSSVIKLRKVLPPNGGVILKINNDENIESIFINEKEDANLRALGGIVRYKDGAEEDFIFILNNPVSNFVYCTEPEKVFMALVKFYEIEYERIDKLRAKYKTMDFEVLSPYYWRYRANNYETTKEKEQRLQGKKVKREFTVNISSFIRKIKGNPSKEAQELAERLCVKLEPNHTIVREHKRTYNKSNESLDLDKISKLVKELSKL